MRQQFAFHSQAPVLTFGNQSALHLLGESSIDEWHLGEAGRSTEATYGRTHLYDSVRRWWLASPLQTNVRLESQKTKDFKKEGGGNGPHNWVLRTCEIPKKRAARFAVAEGKGHCVLRREACIVLKVQALRDGEAARWVPQWSWKDSSRLRPRSWAD